MPFDNMPAGCFGPSDVDHYYALGHREQYCEKCGTDPCECEDIGDMIDEIDDNELLYWAECSELFEPPRNDYHGD